MGMFDTTCGVTHLPIYKPEQACRFFFLRKPLFDEPFNYGTEWLLTSLPVLGVYNGYGTLSKVSQGPVQKLQIETLARQACPIDPAEMRGFEEAKGYPHTLTSLMWACARGLLRLRLPSGVVVPTAPMYVLEEAYQAIVAGDDQTPPIGCSRERILRKRTTDPVENLRNAIYTAVNNRREALLSEQPHKTQDLLLQMASREFASHLENTPDPFVLGDSTLTVEDLKNYPILTSLKDEDWQALSKEVMDLEVFFWTMKNELRRDIAPATYTDQFYFPHQGLTAHQMLANFMMRWCLKTEEEELKAQSE